MEQPIFSCSKCFRNFPQSEMSRSGQTCKTCNPHHSTFKQCEFCKSDFKYYIYGTVCPRCQSLKSKYGEPQPCSICTLKNVFGNALVCQRCLHYRNRFGDPRECQACGQLCAFLKDEESRQKVDGQILCWVCTYNFKLNRSRERSDHSGSKRRHDTTDQSRLKSHHNYHVKRTRADDYDSLKREVDVPLTKQLSSTTQSIDTAYNEHLLTISQLQEEVKNLKRQLTQKDADLLAKDRNIADLRSDLIETKGIYEDRLLQTKSAALAEQDRLMTLVKQLQKEKVSISQTIRKRKSNTNLVGFASALRPSASYSVLFNPDAPLQLTPTRQTSKSDKPIQKSASKEALIDKNDATHSSNADLTSDVHPEISVPDDEALSTPAETVEETTEVARPDENPESPVDGALIVDGGHTPSYQSEGKLSPTAVDQNQVNVSPDVSSDSDGGTP